MRTVAAVVAVGLVLTACSSGTDDSGTPAADVEETVTLSDDRVETAQADASCTVLEAPQVTQATHIEPDAAEPAELYELRPGTAGDHLNRWVEAQVYDERPDERSVVHNHEHGAISVWYEPDAIEQRQLDNLIAWAEARNAAGLANEAGAGVIVSPFRDGFPTEDATVAFRSWTEALDCEAFNQVVADGFLLSSYGNAPEGALAGSLDGVVERATDA